jgi:hypothetical protein
MKDPDGKEQLHSLGSIMMKELRKAASCSDPRDADPPAQPVGPKTGKEMGWAGLDERLGVGYEPQRKEDGRAD